MTLISTHVQDAVQVLQENQLCAIPTETVYGLAGNALNAETVLEIFKVKARPAFDPLIIHIGQADMLSKLVRDIPTAAQELIELHWPGPLTLVLPRKTLVPDLVSSGLDTVAVRMPAHPLTLELLQALPFPLAAPSANPFGYISPTTAQHVHDQLQGKIPMILDGGPCSLGVESTIVGFQDDRPVVYRLGGLTVEAIRKTCPDVVVEIQQGSNPIAPGMLKSHYAPRKPFYLGDVQALAAQFPGKRIGYLLFDDKSKASGNLIELLSETGDMNEATRNLFAAMRRLDTSEADVILAEPVPEYGLGRAINDRLGRAAASD